jgi:hypothetical protein
MVFRSSAKSTLRLARHRNPRKSRRQLLPIVAGRLHGYGRSNTLVCQQRVDHANRSIDGWLDDGLANAA